MCLANKFTVGDLSKLRQAAQHMIALRGLAGMMRASVQFEPAKGGDIAVLIVHRLVGAGEKRSNGSAPCALIPFDERWQLDDVVPYLIAGALDVEAFQSTAHGALAFPVGVN